MPDVAVATVWLLLGAVVWGMGAIALGIGVEDRCLDVAIDHDYGASTQSVSIWPPRFTCELEGPEDPAAPPRRDVQQYGAALVRSGWTVGFLPVWVVAGAGTRWRTGTRPRQLQAQTPTRSPMR